VRYGWHRGQLRAEYETSGEGLQNVSLDSLSQAYQMVTQRVGPSVVHIEVERRLTEEEEEIASLMRGGLGVPHASDQGSGVVVDEQGYVLTNEHVIAGGQSIEVALSDGRRLPARVIGVDPLTDLAVLKVEADGLIPIVFGDSEEAHVGTPVWAVGSPFGLDRTITFGILSGKHRVVKASTRYQDFMQSDVAVNPGNSGGPLVDSRGELIGINTAIVGDTYRGVSFSIPSNVAERVYQRIRIEGVYHRGWLGVGLTEVPDELHTGPDHRVRGALVTDLAAADSPAARAGIEAGDLIKTVDGVTLTDMGHLMRVVGDLPAGVEIEMEIVRDGEPMQLAVTIGKRPSQYAPR
jgi:S1-C subfamily serine protease